MKYRFLARTTFAIWFGCTLSAMADPRIVNDPVGEYILSHRNDLRPPEERNEHVLKFEVDVDNDGKTDVFLSAEKSSLVQGNEYENEVRLWDLYKNTGNGNYAVVEQQKTTAGSQTFYHSGEFEFDPKKIYLGTISEMGGAYGMLAMYHVSRKNGVFISAYLVRNGYFESKRFPDPAAPKAGIYHRDESGKIPDFPAAYQHYFALPPTQKVIILPQTF